MLKLRYLYTNEDLAAMILRNWEFDEDSLEMFQYYRISSNAIYPFRREGAVQLLRFAPIAEKRKENVEAELAFIANLRTEGYGVMEAVKSKRGEELIEVRTPWGDYYASVFKRVPGVQIGKTELRDGIVFSHGQALGRLHKLSSHYEPMGSKRWCYEDVLMWIEEELAEFPQETAALREAERLRVYFAQVPKTVRNYGLVHYDFEYDNVFYDEATSSCYAIDFDDAMYHWYAMDIEQALDSLKDCIPEESYERKKQIFIDGYQSEHELAEGFEAIVPACRRFANLYGYVRVLRSVAEQWENEPEWMVRLRERLERSMVGKASQFDTDIQ
ncbi:phosphotransferase [Paenibacillus sp. PR3]|uniref:Phosphotransferase n=1 Tax=Paenibacillus terricola TaxID=2763503 RepID=A0ABR8MWT1_9BACL|nr:phosphotransferase [Paenibacillus terricola]MBD3920439.1 phosphotransferase [Paenibacillus terricola]